MRGWTPCRGSHRCVSCLNRGGRSEEEVKPEWLAIKEASFPRIEGVDFKVEEALLVKEFVVASLSRFYAKQEEKNNLPPQQKEPATSTTREGTATPPASPPHLPRRVGTGSPWQYSRAKEKAAELLMDKGSYVQILNSIPF